MEPLTWVRRYVPAFIIHQAYLDPLSGKSLVVMTAIVNDHTAELIGLMRQPDVSADVMGRYWDRFKHELRQSHVRRILGKVRPDTLTHYQERYGMQDTGQREDSEAGVLAIVEYPL